ncbi:MAG: helix-turn-helix domain-containing protein [Proteobacteria bacterium]|nr:helix-turn-helix domain-containing protein [Pseudomonadota bacterium]
MDSTRPIRALTRGLEALAALNLRNGATVSEVAQEIRLPRTTVYRILETLCESGFTFRDNADDRYRLTESVRKLSDEFQDEPWVRDIADPLIRQLGQDTAWPLALSAPAGNSMVIRVCTDHQSPLATDRVSPGWRFPMLTSASGRAYLAHCQEQQRTSLLDAVAASGAPEARLARNSVELARVFTEVRTQGYASAATSRRSSDDMTIAVAVNHGELVFAALSIRVAAIAMPLKTAVERFLGPLRACASTIGSRLAEREPVTPACGTPVIPAE